MQKTNNWATQTPMKTGGECRCSGRTNRSCSISGTHRISLVTNQVIRDEWGRNCRIMITTNTTYILSIRSHLWHTFRSGQPSHSGNRKTFEEPIRILGSVAFWQHKLSFIFCDDMQSFWVEGNMCMLIIVCLYMYFRWKSRPVINKGVWDPVNRFYPATFLHLSQVRTWVSNVNIFFRSMIWGIIGSCSFGDICGIVDHYC